MRALSAAVLAAFALAWMSLPAPAAASETLDRIKERGGVAIGYREDRPPMSFRNPRGEVTGYSIDLCLYIVAEIRNALNRPDLSVTFVPVTAESRFDEIVKGNVDLLCGATTKTLARQEIVDFTDLTFVTGGTLMSLADAPISSFGSLKGKKVAAIADTTTIAVLTERLKQAGVDAEVVKVANAKEGIDALVGGKVAAFAGDQVVLIGMIIGMNSDTRFAIANELFSFEPFALALPRGDADFRLLANRALARLYRSGEIAGVYQRWFTRFAKEPPTLLQALYRLNATPE